MKNFTKMIFAMALIMCCAMSASAAKKVLLSANFDDGSSPFVGWGNNHTREVVDGALKITNPSVVNSWEAQMAYDFEDAFLLSSEYTLSMKVRGSAFGQIAVGLQNADDNYQSVGEFGTIDFDETWRNVKVKCLCNGEGGKRLIFSFGEFEGEIYLDDVELSVYVDGPEEIYTGADPALRWMNVLTNSDMEGEELASFLKTENNPEVEDDLERVIPAAITDGFGMDDSRGIKVTAFSGASNDWDAQFFIKVPEPLPAGTALKVTFDYRASTEGSADTQAHSTPGNYLHYSMIGSPWFTTDWQNYIWEGKLSSNQAGSGTFQTIAFNLAKDREQIIDFYFDNVAVYVQNNGLVPQYCNQVILMDLARTTNIPSLVAATGKSRLVYPEGCATVTADGEEVMIASVEAFADGRLYIFIDDLLDEDMDVKVTFTNPTGEAYRIVYTDDNTALPDYDGVAYPNENVEVGDAIVWEYAAPVVMSIDPEDASFNLPSDFNTITVTFDKGTSCDDLVAWLGSERLTVSPATGYAETVTLTRTSTTPLADGEYSIELSKIHSETGIDEAFWGSYMYAVYVGMNDEGTEFMADLEAALNVAINSKAAAEYAIYAGVTYDELCGLIEAYDEEYMSLTSPTECRNVAKILSNAAIAMDNHRNLVDTYYSTVYGGINARDSYSESKFAKMAEFVTFKEDLAKYLDEAGEPIKLYDAEKLQAAVDALSPIVNNASRLFTTGPSKYGTTSVAALVERLRLGGETLKALGVAADDELVVAVDNALSDDDDLAEQLKLRVKTELYKAIKDGKENELFPELIDETTLEIVKGTVDMTVFFKNPNIYISDTEVGGGLGEGVYNAEYMPGWIVPEGATAPKYSVGTYNVAAPHKIVDGTFLQWQSGYQIEQTIIDLPAGVYTIRSSFSERVGNDMNSVFYVKTSATPEGEYAGIDSVEVKGDTPTNNLYLSVENIVVTDGVLTVGVLASENSCTHFNSISVEMTGIIPYFDYDIAYDELIGNIPSTTDAFSLSGTSVFAGSTFSFPVSMTNENGITAFQCDVYLSDGLMLDLNDEGEYDVKLSAGRKTSSHSATASLQPDGSIRVIAYSSSNKQFRGNEGELFSLNLTALEGAAEKQTVRIRNIRLSTADEEEFHLASVSAEVSVKSYTLGDANGDGQVTIVDVVAVVNALMGITSGNFVFDAADMDQNGEITIVDVVAVVNVLMGNNAQALIARSIVRSDIHVADAEVNAGETTTLYVKLDNAQAYTAMQMDVALPEGLIIEGVEMVGNPSHTVAYSEEGRIAAYSLSNSRFNGGETLMAITVKADEGYVGTGVVDFTNVRVVSKDIAETVLADASANIAGGEANGIDCALADENVQVLYYSATGVVSDKPHKGLNIIKRIHEDGRVEVSKEMNK